MCKPYLIPIFISFLLLLASCNQVESPRKNTNFLPLSATDPLKTNEQKEQVNEDIIPNDSEELGYGIPNEHPNEQQEAIEKSEDITELEKKGKVPFQDFKARWNAISLEQGSDLLISSFKLVQLEEGSYYRTYFNNHLELRVWESDSFVEEVQIIGVGKGQSDILTMLTGWSQVYYFLDPDYDPYHVDTLFASLGVGPNLDISNISSQTVIHHGIQYSVQLAERRSYIFKATDLKNNRKDDSYE